MKTNTKISPKIILGNMLSLFSKVKDKYFDSKSFYVAILVYLWMSVLLTPIPVRIAMVICAFIKKRLYRILTVVSTIVVCIIYYGLFSSEILIYGLAIILAVAIIEFYKFRKKNYFNSLILLLLSMVTLTILDATQGGIMEGLYRTYFRLSAFPSSMYRVFSIFIVIEIVRILNVCFNNLKISSLIGFNTMFLFGAINYWTMAITNKEFTLPDLQLAKTVVTVISNVQIEPLEILLFVVYLLVVVAFNICIVKIKWVKTTRKETTIRAVYALISFVLIVSILWSGMFRIYTYKSVTRMGLPCNLIATAKGIDKPTGYDAYMKEIEAKNSKIENPTQPEESKNPNIIIIMSEAFSDLKMVADFETNEDYMPYTRKLMQDYPSGVLYSSVYGNNTASSEYECLTGIPTGLTASGGTIYQSYMEKQEESLVSLLKSQGYHTTGIHPYDGAGYNRNHAWESFGFDEILFKEAFADNARRVRNYISDDTFYDKIIEEYETNNNSGPQFTFGISMQNHGTYGTDYEGDIRLNDMEYDDVNEYLSLLKETDKANEKLINYFSQVEEDTIIVFFGDHQPIVTSDFYSEIMDKDFYELEVTDLSKIYQVPYFVWTNFESDVEVPETASINYLPNIVLDVAGTPKNEWFTFTEEVFKEFPVVTDNFTMFNGEVISQETIKQTLKQVEVPNPASRWHLLKTYQVWAYHRALAK